MGDGRHSIQQLVEQLNRDPRRGDSKHSVLKSLSLDSEAKALLRRAGLTTASIPAPGQFIRLRRIANIAAGGTPVAVTDQVHPDNRHLAVRAAQALRLDIAGVDLLTPDISRSWRDRGAYVCEVNSQPTLGQATAAHLFKEILGKMIAGNGRIPVVVVFGATPDAQLTRQLEARLRETGLTVGCHDNDSVRIAGKVVIDGKVKPFQAGLTFSADRNVEAIILNVNDDSLLSTGMPFARFDLLIIAGMHISTSSPESRNEAVFHQLLTAMLPACDGQILTLLDSGLEIGAYQACTTAIWKSAPVNKKEALDYISEQILELQQHHSNQ